MPKKSVPEIITDSIIELIEEKGVLPWQKTWSDGGICLEPMNLVTKRPYGGINRWTTAMLGKSSPYWMTFSQCSKLGGKVKKGAKHAKIVWWAEIKRKSKKDEEEQDNAETFFAPVKYHRVFNLEDVEGLDVSSLIGVKQDKDTEGFKPLELCEAVIQGFKNAPKLVHRKGGRPVYNVGSDVVTMPQPTDFNTEQDYYSTLFHEFSHSTGHSKRLNRKTLTELSKFADDAYCKEELVAELSASMLCYICKISKETIENSASYLNGWLRALRADPKMLISSAQLAEKAVACIAPTE